MLFPSIHSSSALSQPALVTKITELRQGRGRNPSTTTRAERPPGRHESAHKNLGHDQFLYMPAPALRRHDLLSSANEGKTQIQTLKRLSKKPLQLMLQPQAESSTPAIIMQPRTVCLFNTLFCIEKTYPGLLMTLNYDTCTQRKKSYT